MRVCAIGEVLWDIFPDQERFGGAALNFCANLQRLGDHATLLSAVGDDARGQLAIRSMQALSLDTSGVAIVPGVATGIATVATLPSGEPIFAIPRPAAFDHLAIEPTLSNRAAGTEWLYCGTLLQTTAAVERITIQLLATLHPARTFYDMNLRTGHWNLPLVQRLSHLASIIKLNEAEAETLFAHAAPAGEAFTLEGFCRLWSSTYAVDLICVTLGPAGCLIYQRDLKNSIHGTFVRAPGYPVTVRDTVGSGDAFAAAFLHGYARGWPIAQAARFANALGAIVASRAGATPDWTVEEISAIIASS